MKGITITKDASPCQRLCAEDCRKARSNLVIEDKLSIAGICPKHCNACLYMGRFQQDDVNWTPQPSDPQYYHSIAR